MPGHNNASENSNPQRGPMSLHREIVKYSAIMKRELSTSQKKAKLIEILQIRKKKTVHFIAISIVIREK